MSDDLAVDILVEQVAPKGSWHLASVEQSPETRRTGNATLGHTIDLISGSFGKVYRTKGIAELDHHAGGAGGRRMLNRRRGVIWRRERRRYFHGPKMATEAMDIVDPFQCSIVYPRQPREDVASSTVYV